MTEPIVIVEAAFAGGASTADLLHLDDPARGLLGTGTLAGATPWEDISAYALRMQTRRGANRVGSPILRYEAGTCEIELNNNDRRFDPTNLSGPYVSAGVTQVTPMRAIRLRATWNGVTYDLFRGYADEWRVTYNGPNSSRCVLRCTDAIKVLTNFDRTAVSAVGAGEDSGARVRRILDSISWEETDRAIAVGDTTLQATTLADNAWTELLLVQDTEIGEVYIDAAGRVVFRNRRAALEELRSQAPNVTFGDEPTAGDAPAINYFHNPSAEVDAAGFLPAGLPAPTVARSNTRAQSGTWSVKATWAGGDTFLPSMWVESPSPTGMVQGRTYTWSAYIYVPTGSPDIMVFDVGVTLGESVTVKDAWTRVTQQFVFTGDPTTTRLGLHALGGGDAGDELYVDAVMITEGGPDQVPSYFDGNSVNAEWDGVVHASTSRRLPEIAYADVTVDFDDSTIANVIKATRAGGSEQTAEDAASKQLYLTHTYRRTDLLMQSDTVASDWAAFMLGQAKDPELRFTELVVRPIRDGTRLFPQVLGREFGDRIRIIRRPPGGGTITRDVFIRGVRHDVLPGGDWTTSFVLQSATRWAYFVLDHNTLGVLGESMLAY